MNTENNLSNTVKIASTDDILLNAPEITRTASLFPFDVDDLDNYRLFYENELNRRRRDSKLFFESIFAGKTTTNKQDSLTGENVMRFNDQQTGTHFFTTNSSEIQDRLNNPSRYQSEGNEFDTPSANSPGAIPVYRYFNQQSQTYFYTIQPPNELIAQFPVFSNDGIAFYSYKNAQEAPAGAVPIHRFYNQEASNRAGSPVHFFTGTEQNKQAVQGLAGFDYEGAGFYAYPASENSLLGSVSIGGFP